MEYQANKMRSVLLINNTATMSLSNQNFVQLSFLGKQATSVVGKNSKFSV